MSASAVPGSYAMMRRASPSGSNPSKKWARRSIFVRPCVGGHAHRYDRSTETAPIDLVSPVVETQAGARLAEPADEHVAFPDR